MRREGALLSWIAAALHGLDDLLREAEKIWRGLDLCEQDASIGKDASAVEFEAHWIGVECREALLNLLEVRWLYVPEET